ncbi:MAG: DUF1015 domain-containing protein [Bacteroidia bacterium]|nr:DUF1015 domain-containing protein [Bacteroidia bacterium]
MAVLKAFKGIRPTKEYVKRVACRPYDVLDEKEARLEANGDPCSFYHVIKPEIDFPDGYNVYAPEIYKKGRENFEKMMADGVFKQDEKECLYIYSQTMNGRTQYGIVGCAAVDDYVNDIIKKHELTRPDKEEDRKNHVRVGNMNAEPVFFAYPHVPALDEMVASVVQAEPAYDLVTDDGIGHTFWVINDPDTIRQICELFAKVPFTYVADGHHRTAAAALVGKERRDANPHHTGKEEYNFFLAVHFPDNQLHIMDYNRVIKDLNGHSPDQLLEKLKDSFSIEDKGTSEYRPSRLHEFSMYLEGKWYALTAKPGTYNDHDPIGVLDVTILSERVLAPLFNIVDLRKDKRIDFVGGLRGLGELKRRVDSGNMKIAFALYPVTMKQLIDIADSGQIMPPKTTWFEPKLRSGLVIHSLD